MVDWRTARAGQGAQQDSAGGGGAQSHLLLPHLVSHGDELLPQAQSRLVLLGGGRGRGGALDGDSVLSGLVTVHVDMSLQVELGREALPAAVAVVDGLGPAGVSLLTRAGLSLSDDHRSPRHDWNRLGPGH